MTLSLPGSQLEPWDEWMGVETDSTGQMSSGKGFGRNRLAEFGSNVKQKGWRRPRLKGRGLVDERAANRGVWRKLGQRMTSAT